MELLKPALNNDEARMNFVAYWGKYVKTHSDKDWSIQQNMLINSQLQSAKQLSPKEYLKIKNKFKH